MMKKAPKGLILSLLAISLISLGFSSWVFGQGNPSFNVDVGASSVFDPSAIFSLNNKLGKYGISGIEFSKEGYGVVGDEEFGNVGYLGIHGRINIKEVKKSITTFDSTKQFKFGLELRYAHENNQRNNQYLTSTCLKEANITTSYDPNNDSKQDPTLQANLNNTIVFDVNPSRARINDIVINNIDDTKLGTSANDNANGIVNYVYFNIKLKFEILNNTFNDYLVDSKGGATFIIGCVI